MRQLLEFLNLIIMKDEWIMIGSFIILSECILIWQAR